MNLSAASIATPAAVPRIISRSEHNVSRSHISPNALRVLYRLKDAGFMAFLVGGCVRDLLIGIEPKDFDVATDALPDQVRKLFRNCRLVGRRFRLAHVFFGREIIEVATFRAASAPAPGEEALAETEAETGSDADADIGDLAELDDVADTIDAADGEPNEAADVDEVDRGRRAASDIDREPLGLQSPAPVINVDVDGSDFAEARGAAHTHGFAGARGVAAAAGSARASDGAEQMFDETGRILRDNLYGTIDADVWRRDLTANALYYNIADFSIWDYTGGFADIAARRLKMIGDPEVRFREDPVRMLRAARFEAKLGFDIEVSSAEPIGRLRGLLGGVPPARLFDETLKLFLTGHGTRSLEVLRQRGLFEALLPTVAHYLEAHPGTPVEKLLIQGLHNTDQRVVAGKPVTPTFLFALLLYGPIAAHIEAAPPERWHELATILQACDRAIRACQAHIALPKRFSLGVREMFALQPRLEHPRGRRALRVLEHPRFRAAYDLLLLRAEQGMASREIAAWWTRIQEASAEERADMADALTGQTQRPEGPRRGGRRRRRRRGPAGPV